ncbi:MAG: aldose epimerase family protein [Bacteroidota bacterium]
MSSPQTPPTDLAPELQVYALRNAQGVTAEINNFGARITRLCVPDRNGHLADVVLGLPTPGHYRELPETFFGATIGRFANRIAGARFILDGIPHQLPRNQAPNHLHGGDQGFHRQLWTLRSAAEEAVELELHSPDQQEGYPGNLTVRVRFALTQDNGLQIDYWAVTDAPTPLNLTNHAFFNLRGAGHPDLQGHSVQIDAAHFHPLGPGNLPTGATQAVGGTPFDFRTPADLNARLATSHPQLTAGRGFDHNFVLNGTGLRKVTQVTDQGSGRTLEVWTDLPGMQFYSGNFLDGTVLGKSGVHYPRRSAFCCETQHFPDNLNQAAFPASILRPGEIYRSTSIYRFGTVS